MLLCVRRHMGFLFVTLSGICVSFYSQHQTGTNLVSELVGHKYNENGATAEENRYLIIARAILHFSSSGYTQY